MKHAKGWWVFYAALGWLGLLAYDDLSGGYFSLGYMGDYYWTCWLVDVPKVVFGLLALVWHMPVRLRLATYSLAAWIAGLMAWPSYDDSSMALSLMGMVPAPLFLTVWLVAGSWEKSGNKGLRQSQVPRDRRI